MGVTVLVVATVVLLRLADPLGVRPDSWSEAEVIISGINYTADGFWVDAALPLHQIAPPRDPYFLYANYPVLSNLVYGVLHRWGVEAHGLYRIPALLSSLLALWLWYRLVARVVDLATAVAAALALASAFGFLSYADNIHQQAYPLAPQIGALLCLAMALAPGTASRWRWLIGGMGCVMLVGLLTVERHLWLAIALLGYARLFGAAGERRAVALLILPLCLGVALQWLQIRVGSPVPPDERPTLAQSLYRRSLGFAEASDTPRDETGAPLSLATYPRFLVARFQGFYLLSPWMLPLFVGFGYWAAKSRAPGAPRWPPALKLLALLFAAGAGWMGTMMQQTAAHPATMRQLLLFYALLLGVLWTEAFRMLLDRQRGWPWRIGAALVILGSAVPHALGTWSFLRMHLDHTYRHPLIQEPGWQESADLAPLRTLPAGSVILTNHNRVPLIRYWSRHPAYLAPNGLAPGEGERRNWLELTLNHLRDIYHDDLPPLVYLYRIVAPNGETIVRALRDDPLLRGLATGSFEPLRTPEAEQRAVQAIAGTRHSAATVLLRGSDWLCFDLTPVLPALRQIAAHYPIPHLKDLPPPR